MTDEDVLEKYRLMGEFFKTDLPNPEQEPIRFAYYVRLYTHFSTPNVTVDFQDFY